MASIITTFGFDGLDIDLETTSIALDPGDKDFRAPTTPRIVNLIRAITLLLARFPGGLMLTAAPETAYVQGGAANYSGVYGAYLPVLHALRDAIVGAVVAVVGHRPVPVHPGREALAEPALERELQAVARAMEDLRKLADVPVPLVVAQEVCRQRGRAGDRTCPDTSAGTPPRCARGVARRRRAGNRHGLRFHSSE